MRLVRFVSTSFTIVGLFTVLACSGGKDSKSSRNASGPSGSGGDGSGTGGVGAGSGGTLDPGTGGVGAGTGGTDVGSGGVGSDGSGGVGQLATGGSGSGGGGSVNVPLTGACELEVTSECDWKDAKLLYGNPSAPDGFMPTGWTRTSSSDQWVISGGGALHDAQSDSMMFSYLENSRATSIRIRVTALDDGPGVPAQLNDGGQVGVTFRESTDEGSRHVTLSFEREPEWADNSIISLNRRNVTSTTASPKWASGYYIFSSFTGGEQLEDGVGTAVIDNFSWSFPICLRVDFSTDGTHRSYVQDSAAAPCEVTADDQGGRWRNIHDYAYGPSPVDGTNQASFAMDNPLVGIIVARGAGEAFEYSSVATIDQILVLP